MHMENLFSRRLEPPEPPRIEEPEEPRYKNSSEDGPRYLDVPESVYGSLNRAADRVVGYLTGLLGKPPYLGDLKVRIARLPAYVYQTAEGGVEHVSKVFGLYDPNKGEAIIDPVLYADRDDPERNFLENAGIEIPTAERVAAEEITHHVQSGQGIIDRLVERYGREARGYIEGAAASISDRLFGETPIYDGWKRRFRDFASRFGEKAAFQGIY